MKGHVSCPFFITRGREVASRRAHNPETAGSNPAPAMKKRDERPIGSLFPFVGRGRGQDENPVGLPELPQGQAPKARRSSGERGIQRREAPWESCPAGYFFCAYPLLCYGRTIRFGPLGVAPGHIGKGYLFQRSVAWRKCIESSTTRSAR